MQEIQDNLQKLRLFVIVGQISSFVLRLYAQVALSLSSALIVFQTILSLVMYCKFSTTLEASIFILIELVLLYIIVINGLDTIFNPRDSSQNYFQNFNSFYINCGFWMQVPFRFLFILIMWRSFQYSKIFEMYQAYSFHEQQSNSNQTNPIV